METVAARRVSLTYPVDALVSYHYYGEDRHIQPLATSGKLQMIGDSGAFSAWSQGVRIELDEYAAWCRRWWDHLCWCASLDVIGDPQGSWRNWRTLRDKHHLLTVPTLHAGTDRAWLDAYAAEGVDLVGLGGMAAVGQAPRAYRWVVHMMAYARKHWPQIRFHLWGVSSRQFLANLPVWSADSSGTLGQGYRFGTLRLFDPATGRHHHVSILRKHHGRHVYRYGWLLRQVYGVDPATVETSHAGNRKILIQLAAASTQQYALWLQRRHQVTPPSMFRPAGASTCGPRLHAAIGTPGRGEAGDEGHALTDGDTIQGPRVHLVPNSGNKPGNSDLDAVTGPRLHTTDGNPKLLQKVINEREGDGDDDR